MNINKNIYLQTKYTLLAIIGIISYFAIYQIAHGAYQQMFTISAYYSPIEGQAKYVTGSYEGDIRLNGSGVNSADGTPVYPGMIAAPSTYAFGTKMNIPGIGIVSVHDRGGAIVHAGERGQNYDRLDIWMGYGDTGLSRALNWGKRDVEATIYGIDPSLKENVYLEGFTEAEKFVRTLISEQTIFKDDLWFGNSGDKVGELQQYLTDLGYYKGKLDNYYGDAVYKAVIQFQLDQNIIDRAEEFGAGYFGPRTREKIEAVIENRRKDLLPKYNLGKDDDGEEVKKLQQALKDLGYDIEVTGVYDEQTIKAVFEFQKDNEVINDEGDIGAGYFGPQTYTVLSLKINEFNIDVEDNFHEDIIVQAEYDEFNLSLQLGDSGEDVAKLQEELKKFNLFRTKPTGFYGAVTENAVYKFQQIKGLVADKNSIGAGVFGPVTREAMNGVLGYRANTKQLIASKTATFNENKQKEQKSFIANILSPLKNPEPAEEAPKILAFTSDLTYGSSGEEVETLQKSLKDLGYFDGVIVTSYFGDVTKNAVINFQKAQNIISSEDDQGAGHFGPQTRDLLNSLL
jgi:peptidoglycan hydrolase-like protein with peptidoglycan-binding domain/3D (Asp-Asp-Asp) domain-containing protein